MRTRWKKWICFYKNLQDAESIADFVTLSGQKGCVIKFGPIYTLLLFCNILYNMIYLGTASTAGNIVLDIQDICILYIILPLSWSWRHGKHVSNPLFSERWWGLVFAKLIRFTGSKLGPFYFVLLRLCHQSWEKCWGVPQAEIQRDLRSWGIQSITAYFFPNSEELYVLLLSIVQIQVINNN